MELRRLRRFLAVTEGLRITRVVDKPLACNGDQHLGSLTLFANDDQIALLQAPVVNIDFSHADQMDGEYQMLSAYDLVWSELLNEYLLSERCFTNDLLAWNAEGANRLTNMYSQYLWRLCLNNDHYQIHTCSAAACFSSRDVSLEAAPPAFVRCAKRVHRTTRLNGRVVRPADTERAPVQRYTHCHEKSDAR